jgi:hypothetical protein
MERRSLLKSIIALLVPQQQQQPQAPGGKRDVLSHNECGDMSAGHCQYPILIETQPNG